jgi:iron(III) transport system permease protein
MRKSVNYTLMIAAMALLLFFVLFPLITVFFESVWNNGFTLNKFKAFFENAWLRKSLVMSFKISFASVIMTSLVGIPLAYILVRTDLPGKGFFKTLILIPLIIPPFMGAFAFIYLFGMSGSFNMLLMKIFGFAQPLFNIYTEWEIPLLGNIPWAVVLVQTLHLYPLVYLNVLSSLCTIDPSVEESARSMGATGLKLFTSVTFPLILPGYFAGIILVFIWTFSDLGTPIMLGYHKTIAADAYVRIMAYQDISMGVVESVIMALVSIAALIASKQYLSIKSFRAVSSGIAYSALVKPIKGMRKYLALTFVSLIVFFSILPNIAIIVASFAKYWSMSILPNVYTLDHFRTVFESLGLRTSIYISILYSVIATFFGILIGVLIAYILLRTDVWGKGVLDVLAILPFAVPGTVMAIAYMRFFNFAVGGVPLYMAVWMTPLGPLCLLPLVHTFRRLPYSVRASYASLLSVDKTIEEASENLGGTRFYTFRKITLPLILIGVIAGGMLTFVNVMTELSTTVFLSPPSVMPMTLKIFGYVEGGGGLGDAAALGSIMILITMFFMVLINRVLGEKVGGMFRVG